MVKPKLRRLGRNSWLPPGGTNLFQEVKAACAEHQPPCRLTIGQPQGPALLSAREEAARRIMKEDEQWHEYQDNGVIPMPEFGRRFTACHAGQNFLKLGNDQVAYLPTPGTKPMLGLIPLACGAANHKLTVATTTNPGYPTPADWCSYLAYATAIPLTTNSANKFLFDPEELLKIKARLVMMNYPSNPTGQVMSEEWLRKLCALCEEHGIRLFNDGAYTILDHYGNHVTLAQVAIDFPNLSWAEAFSASKAGNFTGWRVACMVGSPDFIGDIAKIKGNTDSGLVAPMAAGVLYAFEMDMASIKAVQSMYLERIKMLTKALTDVGMQLAVKPQAGFFTLWNLPQEAFGHKVMDARQFNYMMIEHGVAGVHFNPYMRYGVCCDVAAMIDQIATAFKKAKVRY